MSCMSCDEGMAKQECPKSKRPCGHHCDCTWTQDHCCWCDKHVGAEDKMYDTFEEACNSYDQGGQHD